jgi:Domain of unknown function (DUF4424)
MHLKSLFCLGLVAAGFALFTPSAGRADDSAASIAAGGLVTRRETRIVMAKEVLQISPTQVVVDYDFRNDTAADVTTEVAFPVPAYTYGPDNPAISAASFSDFKLVIGGKPATYQTEAKATLNGKDVTSILTADKIDIASFGHLTEPSGNETQTHTPDIDRLPKAEQQRLAQLGLYDAQDGWGLWTVQLKYHWTQTFPANSTVHIQHQYTPVEGGEIMLPETLKDVAGHVQPTGDADSVKDELADMQRLQDLCPDPGFLSNLIKGIDSSAPGYGQYAHPNWVDFILTSANTWKQPIEDFTLIIARGESQEPDAQVFISFCSPQSAPVTKLDANRFQVHLTNFVPKDELRIGYFDVPEAKPATASLGNAPSANAH